MGVLTAYRLISSTTITCCHYPWQPETMQESTYKSGLVVQTTGTTSDKDTNLIFIESKNIKLRPILDSDAQHMAPWYNKENLQKNTAHHRFPITIGQELEIIEKQRSNPHLLALAVVNKKDQHIGNIFLININHLDQKAELSIHIFDESKEKTRNALEATSLILHHGFYALNLNKVYLGLLEGLKGWGSLLHDFFGFSLEGTKRQDVYKDGSFKDMLMYSVLKNEYESSHREDDKSFQYLKKPKAP
jgi:RimJ/RimL family protein N-acetyltransferase